MASPTVKMLFFSLQSAKKGGFYLMNENRQALGGLKWTTLERFQTALWTCDSSKCRLGLDAHYEMQVLEVFSNDSQKDLFVLLLRIRPDN